MPTASPARRAAPWRAITLLGLLILLLTAVLATAQAPEGYTIATFDMWPNMVAKNGTVGGTYLGFPGRWKPGWTVPQVLPGATLPGDVYGVNRLDQYVGCQDFPDGQRKAMFFGPTRSSVATMKLPVGSEGSCAIAINDVGEVIGSAWSSQWGQDDLKLLRWPTPTSTPIVVSHTRATNGPNFEAINRHGLAMGFDWGEDNATGQPFTHARGAAGLTYLPQTAWGTPFAINSLGWMAGADGQIWFSSGETTHLPLWCPDGAGTPVGMHLHGINQQVSAVGLAWCHDAASDQGIGYAIRADDVPNSTDWVMHDLNALVSAPGCHLQAAHAISEAHHIVGTATCSGVEVGFLLTPVVSTVAAE